MARETVNGAALSKSRIAYEWIKARIGDGTFSPGYRLVLGQLAQELGVSVVPIREAIRLLEAEGLVTFERNVGAQVAMVDESDYQHTTQAAPASCPSSTRPRWPRPCCRRAPSTRPVR